MLSSLLSVAVLLHPAASPAPLHYRLHVTGMRQYERDDLSTVGGEFDVMAYVTTTDRDSAGGRIGHVVIDSVRSSGTGLLSMTYDSSVGTASRGVWLDVSLDRRNGDASPVPSTRNPVTGVVAQYARAFFAPEHASLVAGGAWTDTLDVHTITETSSRSGPTITHWKVTALAGDSVELEGTIAGVIAVSGRVSATGVVLGQRTATLSHDGILHQGSLTTTQQMLLANQGATEARSGRGSTTATIDLQP
jgi:hypothetical protein